MMLSMTYGITGGMIDGYICTRGVFTKNSIRYYELVPRKNINNNRKT